MNNFDEEDSPISKAIWASMILGLVALVILILASACRPAAPAAQEAQYKAAQAVYQENNEAIEKEAHSRHHGWIHVELTKVDGHCSSMGSYSARSIMDSVAPEEVRLISAQKVGDDEFVLSYKRGAWSPEFIFVTSESLCEQVIQKHLSN